MKLGVCIPYRDTGDGVRKKHLDTLVPHLEKFFNDRNIDFRCYIGHQIDDNKFNRSGTKNVAFLAAKEDGCDYMAFHDVDMLPHDDVDYSHPGDTPKHIATYLSQWDYTLRDIEYFGGVVVFTPEQFESVNGYHTNYWGWGMEDDDLYWRCIRKGYFKSDFIKGFGNSKVLEFDGEDTHIIVPPSDSLNTIPHQGFEIEAIVYSEIKKESQEFLIGGNISHIKYPILCKKGWDFDFCYDNTKAFSYLVWDFKNEHYHGWVKRHPNQWSKVNFKVDLRKQERMITINDVIYTKKFGIQNSILPINRRLKKYGGIPLYIGRNSPVSQRRFMFKGKLQSLKIKSSRDEILLHYDMNSSLKRNRDGMYVKDLSGKNNDGELILGKGKITKANVEEIPNTIVPDRRYGTMECMYHEDEGIVNQKFAGDPKATAKNEIIYKKKMQKNQIDIDTDEYGLREMKYQIDSIDTIYNRHQIINVRF